MKSSKDFIDIYVQMMSYTWPQCIWHLKMELKSYIIVMLDAINIAI